MSELAKLEYAARQKRIEVIAGQAMIIAGIDHDSIRTLPDGRDVWVSRADNLQRMTHHLTSCPEIGNVGQALLRGAGFKV